MTHMLAEGSGKNAPGRRGRGGAPDTRDLLRAASDVGRFVGAGTAGRYYLALQVLGRPTRIWKTADSPDPSIPRPIEREEALGRRPRIALKRAS